MVDPLSFRITYSIFTDAERKISTGNRPEMNYLSIIMVTFWSIFLVKMVPVSTKCSIIDFRTGTGSPLWHTRNNFGFLGRLKSDRKIKIGMF